MNILNFLFQYLYFACDFYECLYQIHSFLFSHSFIFIFIFKSLLLCLTNRARKLGHHNENENVNECGNEKKAAKRSAIKIQSAIRMFLVITRFKRYYNNDNNNDKKNNNNEMTAKSSEHYSEMTLPTITSYSDNKKVNKENENKNSEKIDISDKKIKSEKKDKREVIINKKDTKKEDKFNEKGKGKEKEKGKEKRNITLKISTPKQVEKDCNENLHDRPASKLNDIGK